MEAAIFCNVFWHGTQDDGDVTSCCAVTTRWPRRNRKQTAQESSEIFEISHYFIFFNELICGQYYDDVMTWKHFPHCRPFVKLIQRSLVYASHNGTVMRCYEIPAMYTAIHRCVHIWYTKYTKLHPIRIRCKDLAQ